MKRALILTSIQGHQSIAQAITAGLQEHGWTTHTHLFADPFLSVYRWMYRHAPILNLISYFGLFLPGMRSVVEWHTRRTHGQEFFTALTQMPDPEVIIGTSFGFNAVVQDWRAAQQRANKAAPPYYNVMVDPRTFYRAALDPHATLNLVFDAIMTKRCQAVFPHIRTAETGWFVRPQFRLIKPKEHIRVELGLDPNKTTFLFVSGSEGETKSVQLIPHLLQQQSPLQIIFACGYNAALKSQLDALSAAQPAGAPVTLFPFSFTPDLHRYMQAADLIIGKAGPNTLFEAVAAETPFFATSHIPGQETGNLDIIREYHLGYVEERNGPALHLLNQIAANPNLLNNFHSSIRELAEKNDRAIQTLTSLCTT